MKKYMFGLILVFLLLSIVTVYAYQNNYRNNMMDNYAVNGGMMNNDVTNDNYDDEYMDSMHESMIKNINDPELAEDMNEMHERCEAIHERYA